MPQSDSAPQPWDSAGYRNHDLARLYDALYRHRAPLSAWYPWVAVAPSRFGSMYGSLRPQTIGGLIRLWERWQQFRGRCPACRGPVLGLRGGGGLSIGHLTGVCRRCGLLVTRQIGCFSAIVAGVNEVFAGTPYRLAGTEHPSAERDLRPVLAVLQELGEVDLPSPTAEGFQGRRPGQRGDVGRPRR